MSLKRYKAKIEYDGTNYSGFQKQKSDKTIGETIEKAIFNVSRETIDVICSGRTDSGVHAEGQVIHFDLAKDITEFQLLEAINHYLKKEDIVFKSLNITSNNFDARHSAESRLYRYQILNSRTPSALLKNKVWHIKKTLCINSMQKAANYLIGEHDFESFRDSQCQAKHAIRHIESINLSRNQDLIFFHIKANAFLHHMVRIIMGSLVEVGYKKWDPIKIQEILAIKDRNKAGPTAPAHGLFLEKIIYNKDNEGN